MSTAGTPLPRERSLLLDTRPLGTVPGAFLQVHRSAVLQVPAGAEMMRIPAGAEVFLDLVLTCVEEGVLATGEVEAEAEAECARCLRQFPVPTSTALTELYAYQGSAAAMGAEEDEVRLLDDALLNLEPALVDAFGLDFPLAPTCESLTGTPCQDPDVPAPDGVSGEDDGRIDPRWSGLVERFGRGTDGP